MFGNPQSDFSSQYELNAVKWVTQRVKGDHPTAGLSPLPTECSPATPVPRSSS